MTLEEFKNEALTKFTKEITDIFFCFIENDRELLYEYLIVLGRENNLDQTNRKLGEEMKNWFNLENIMVNEERKINKKPKSKLIRSYTEHVKK